MTNLFDQTGAESTSAGSTRLRTCRRSRPPKAHVAMGVIGLLAGVVAGCSGAAKSDQASKSGSDAETSTASTTSSGAANTSATQTSAGYKIVGKIPQGALKPGGYALPPIGGDLDEPYAAVDIPAGYTNWETFIEADKPVEPGDPLMIGLWVITGVYLNPCAESNEVSPRSVGATAHAFVQQHLTSATRPRPIDLAGYHGLYMEVTTPTDLDYTTCNDAEVNLWEGRPDGGYWTRMPGIVNRLWIVDIDGQPMTIHMAIPPSATPPQIDHLTHVVEAATFQTS